MNLRLINEAVHTSTFFGGNNYVLSIEESFNNINSNIISENKYIDGLNDSQLILESTYISNEIRRSLNESVIDTIVEKIVNFFKSIKKWITDMVSKIKEQLKELSNRIFKKKQAIKNNSSKSSGGNKKEETKSDTKPKKDDDSSSDEVYSFGGKFAKLSQMTKIIKSSNIASKSSKIFTDVSLDRIDYINLAAIEDELGSLSKDEITGLKDGLVERLVMDLPGVSSIDEIPSDIEKRKDEIRKDKFKLSSKSNDELERMTDTSRIEKQLSVDEYADIADRVEKFAKKLEAVKISDNNADKFKDYLMTVKGVVSMLLTNYQKYLTAEISLFKELQVRNGKILDYINKNN